MLKGYSTKIKHFESEIWESEIETAAEVIRGSGLHKWKIFSKEDLLRVNTRIMERRSQLHAIRSLPFVYLRTEKTLCFKMQIESRYLIQLSKDGPHDQGISSATQRKHYSGLSTPLERSKPTSCTFNMTKKDTMVNDDIISGTPTVNP